MSLKQVSWDDWAQFLIQYPCYGTEPDKDTLRHVHNVTGETLGEVLYSVSYPLDKSKLYFINTEVTSEKKIRLTF